MPIYEYQCLDCTERFSQLVLNPTSFTGPACPHCRSGRVEKLMSRFAAVRSEESRLERMADPSSLAGLDEHDPSSVARWAKKMGREMGDEAGEGFDEMVDQAVDEEMGGGEGAAGGQGVDGNGDL
jgi:putative FmdB family regulatory protein